MPDYTMKAGDTISIYWDGDKRWYSGEVLEADEQGNCHVLYDDGEQERLNLGEVKYRTGRNWKGSLRGKKKKDGKDPILEAIIVTLFDIEDRLPPKGVFKNKLEWWDKWHNTVLHAAESANIKDIAKATLEIALQMKKNITTTWWLSNHVEWKKQLKKASTLSDIDLLVKELRIKVVDWSAARQLFGHVQSQHGQEQKVKVSRTRIAVETASQKDIRGLDASANVDSKSLVGTNSEPRLQPSRERVVQEIQSNSNNTNINTAENQDACKAGKQSRIQESKFITVQTRQSRKRKMGDLPDKNQNNSSLENDPDSDVNSHCFRPEVNAVIENSLTITSDFGMKEEHVLSDGKESLLMGETVDSKNMTRHGNQDEEQYDVPAKEKCYSSMETDRSIRKGDDHNLNTFENSNDTSQGAKQEKEEKSSEGKNIPDVSNGTIPSMNLVQDKEQFCTSKERKHQRETYVQHIDHNISAEQECISDQCRSDESSCKQKQLKGETKTLSELRRSLPVEGESSLKQHSHERNSAEDSDRFKRHKSFDNAEDHEKDLNFKPLKLDEPSVMSKMNLGEVNSKSDSTAEDSPHLERDKLCHNAEDNDKKSNLKPLKIDKPNVKAKKKERKVKSSLNQYSHERNSAEDSDKLEREKLCHISEDHNKNLNLKPPKQDGPNVMFKRKLRSADKVLNLGKLASSYSEEAEGKGDSGYALGVKDVASKNEFSFCSPGYSRGAVMIGKAKATGKGEKTHIQRNANKSKTGKEEQWKIEAMADLMTLRMTRSKATEISSTDEGIATTWQEHDGGKVSGANSSTDPMEDELSHITLNQLCSVCQSGGADSLLLLCDGKDCFHSFHTFCLQPPLLTIPDGDWVCPYCTESSSVNFKRSNKGGNLYPPKKIEKIIGRRQVQVGTELKDVQLEYLVKWVSLSHHHDTWVPESWVLNNDRARVINFQRKFPINSGSVPVLVDERKPEWLKIDRVIACREKVDSDNSLYEVEKPSITGPKKNGKYEFLVKWMGLDYCDATWEDSCNEELLGTADKLVERHQKANERVETDSGHPVGLSLKEQPTYLNGGILHGYQLQGIKWLLNNFEQRRNVILADEMGLGKTIQAIAFLVCMKNEKLNSKPVLVIAPKSTLPGWDQEFRKWGSDLNVILYQGDKDSRSCIREHEFYTSTKRVLFDVLVTSFELAMVDNFVLQKFKWSSVIVDEGHRIKNFRSKLGTLLKQQATDFRLLLTGTPLQNTLAELFALLHFLDPSEVPDPEYAACAFSEIGVKSDQCDSAKSVENISRIHELLQPRMLRRLKSEVLRDMIPGKRLVEVPCALAIPQRRLYVNLLKKNYKELNKGIRNGHKRSLNSLLVDLKMCCNHPYLFPGQEPVNTSLEKAFEMLVGASGKLQLLEKLLPRLKQGGHRVLLFSQMTKMLDILEDFLNFLGFVYCRMDGSTSASERQHRIKNFSSPDSGIFIFLISTRAGGLGINLPSADTVIIYDPDFNPFVDLQAQSRAHRIGQEKPVIVYQLITKCSVEERILQRSRRKLALENLVMNPCKNETFKELHEILLHGARNILDEKDIAATSIHYTDEDIEILLNRDIKVGEKDASDLNGYLGAIQGMSMVQDEEAKPAVNGKQWEELLGPITDPADEEEELGRGKRQRKEVTYTCDPISDDDEEYSPSTSNSSEESSSPCEYSITKNPHKVTSVPEASLEQQEQKPEIGSFAGSEAVHGLHSKTLSMSTESGYSSRSLHVLTPTDASISFGSSTTKQKPFNLASTLLSGYTCLNSAGHISHNRNDPSTSFSTFTAAGFREGYDQTVKQKMQSAFLPTEHYPNEQNTMIESSFKTGVIFSGSTGLDVGKTGQLPVRKRFECFQDQLVETGISGYPPSHVNYANRAECSKLLFPASMKKFQSSIHDQGQPSILQSLDPADKFKVPHKADLSHKRVLSCSQIPQDPTARDSHSREQLIAPQRHPLISQIEKRADAILERVSQITPKSSATVKDFKHVSADDMSRRSTLITDTSSSPNLGHLSENSLPDMKLDTIKQNNHLSHQIKREPGLT